MKRLALGLVSALVTLLLGELALRAVGFTFHVYPEKVQFGWPPSIGGEHDPYERDADLLWVPHDYHARLARARQDPPRLVLLGDSCTEFGTYAEALMRRFRRRAGADWSALKLGVGGWTTYQGLAALERDVLPLRPDVVTFYFGWNDHWKGFGIEDRDIRGLPFMDDPKLQRMRLAQLVQKATIALRGKNYARQRVRLDDFRANLTRMVNDCRKTGATGVLITAPSSHVVGHEPDYLKGRMLDDLAQLVPLHRAYADAVRQVAAREGAPLCDLLADFDALSPEERTASFGGDGIHLTRAGSERAAEMLWRCFESQGIAAALLHPAARPTG